MQTHTPHNDLPSPPSPVNWNLDTLDWQHAGTDPSLIIDAASDVMDAEYPGSIIHLQHDLLQAVSKAHTLTLRP